MSKRSLFNAEETIIHEITEIIENDVNKDNPLLSDLIDLFNSYKKLYKQSSRLVKISDRQQEQLRQAEEDLRKSEEKYRGLYNSSKEGIVYMDLEGGLQEANPAFIDMCKYTINELTHMKLSDLTPQKWHDADQKVIETQIVEKGFCEEFEKELISKGGKIIPVAVRLWLLKNIKDQPVGMWGMIRDISERKRSEQLKEDIERMMRHDLKTPLNGVIGFSNRMRQKLDHMTQWSEQIYSSGLQILNMVEHSLDMFKMEEGTYRIKQEPCNLLSIFQIIQNELSELVHEKSITLEYQLNHAPIQWEKPYIVVGEIHKLQNMISNLLKNAIEASPPNEKISIDIIDKTNHEIVLHNKGAVPKDIRDHFFERYVTSGKQKGTGLGTYSALLIAKAHGGDITFKTSQKEGTFLTVTLPKIQLIDLKNYLQDPNQKHLVNPIPQQSSSKPIVLLVEDTPINQQLATELLQDIHVDVDIAENGILAIQALQKKSYQVVLMDMNMPEMDGFETIKEIRKNPEFKNLPVIAMSAYSQDEAAQDCLKAGMNDYISKPIDPVNFYSVLNKYIPIDSQHLFIKDHEPNSNLPPESSSDTQKTIDMDRAIKRMMGKKDLFMETLKQFATDYRNVVNDIKNAFELKDLVNAKRLIHSLKGLSGTISADALFETAKSLENSLTYNKYDDFPHLLQNLNSEVDRVFQSIQTIIGHTPGTNELHPEKKHAKMNLNMIKPMFEKLSSLLEDYDSDSKDVLISIEDQIAHYEISPKAKSLKEKLKQKIKTYDFDGAYEALQGLGDMLGIWKL